MKRNKYILTAVLFVVAVFTFDYYFIEPKSEILRESIESRYDTLQKYEYFIKGANITEEEIESVLNDIKALEKRLIQEKTKFLSSAKLQSEISDMINKAGLKVLLIKPLSTEKVNNYTNMPIYFEGNGDIKQIGDFLKYLESSKLMIKIDKLSLNVTNVQNPKDLKFKIQVSGLAKT